MGKPPKISPRLLDQAFEDMGISGSEKLVLLVMCRRGNKTRKCFMSIARLMVESGLSRSTIKRALGLLRKKRRIVFEGRRGRSGISQYALHPYIQSDPSGRSDRAHEVGHDDPQNLKLNQKENPGRPVDELGISRRLKTTVQVGDRVNRVLSSVQKPKVKGD